MEHKRVHTDEHMHVLACVYYMHQRESVAAAACNAYAEQMEVSAHTKEPSILIFARVDFCFHLLIKLEKPLKLPLRPPVAVHSVAQHTSMLTKV